MLAFGQTIFLWRMRRGLTQAQLAKAARMARPNLSAIERGSRDVSLRTLRVLAGALQVRPGQLADGEPPLAKSKTPLGRDRLDRIAHAAVLGSRLPDAQEQSLAMGLREASRARLEAAGVSLPRTRRGRRRGRCNELLLRSHVSPSELRSLLDRLSDHAASFSKKGPRT